jgi:hypothetical protein
MDGQEMLYLYRGERMLATNFDAFNILTDFRLNKTVKINSNLGEVVARPGREISGRQVATGDQIF